MEHRALREGTVEYYATLDDLYVRSVQLLCLQAGTNWPRGSVCLPQPHHPHSSHSLEIDLLHSLYKPKQNLLLGYLSYGELGLGYT